MTAATATTPRNSIAFAALTSGAYASAATALLFLLVDATRGQLLYTPSLLGQVVLLGGDPASVEPLRLDMVALYSLVHLVVFVLIGAAATALYEAWSLLRVPMVLGAALMAVLTAGAFSLGAVAYPGLVAAIGPVWLVAGNLAAAGTMAWLIRSGTR
ncbi:MAG: hypothetical protein OEO79_11110 [Gemmatimonadota bacterium]|nr:hypothetical protein [Gemmatimonadota bacterium]